MKLLALATFFVATLAIPSSYDYSGSNVITIASTVQSSSNLQVIIIDWFGGGSSTVKSMNSPTVSAGTTHAVTVGGSAGLVYSPSSIAASVGDMVKFTFMSENHTLTQSSFTEPCVGVKSGINSGFMPNANNSVSPPPYMTFQVLTADPTWFYCAQTGHCGKGMVFSINASLNKTFSQFQSLAIAQNGTSNAASASTAVSASSAVAVASSTASAVVASGSGTSANGQVCACSCLCGVNAFPANAGIGSFGGMSGSMLLT